MSRQPLVSSDAACWDGDGDEGTGNGQVSAAESGCVPTWTLVSSPGLEGFHGEAAAGRSLGAGQEAEAVLHVEGGDGQVEGSRKDGAGR